MNDFEITAQGDRAIVMTRTFDAPKELVFDAFTNPEMVKQWMYGPDEHSLTICEIDLRVDGNLRYVWSLGDKTEMGMSGTYVAIDRPNRIVHTELFDEDWTGGETEVTTEFLETDDRTRVTMTVLYKTPDSRDTVLKSQMADGVATCFDRLETLLAINIQS